MEKIPWEEFYVPRLHVHYDSKITLTLPNGLKEPPHTVCGEITRVTIAYDPEMALTDFVEAYSRSLESEPIQRIFLMGGKTVEAVSCDIEHRLGTDSIPPLLSKYMESYLVSKVSKTGKVTINTVDLPIGKTDVYAHLEQQIFRPRNPFEK